MSRRDKHVEELARGIVKDASKYHGYSWHEMSIEHRTRACASGVVGLVLAQHKQYDETLSFLQAVAHRVHELVGFSGEGKG